MKMEINNMKEIGINLNMKEKVYYIMKMDIKVMKEISKIVFLMK